MNEIFNYLKDKEKLKLAIDINSALKGRNYITEFPETMKFLEDRIYQLVDDANPHPENGFPILNIASDPDHEFVDWRFYFEDSGAYVTNDKGISIHLFYPSDIYDEKLRSLIFENEEIADEWLSILFNQIRANQQILI